MKNKTSLLFLCLALIALLLGMLFGILAGVQYILPQFIKDILPFHNLRPFHVTSVISWIVLAATGGVYYYLPRHDSGRSRNWLTKTHFVLFALSGILIYWSYYTQRFGGKEYLEFPPYLILPIIVGWVFFGINYFKITRPIKDWPVYFWMWGTGIVLMMYHLSEAYLWLNPNIGLDFIKSLTIQWKAGGSFVGAWNMLVYGTAIFLMAKIKGDDSIGRNKTAFFFYFLGLSNLMFGWAHHLYIVPTAPWVRGVSYAISMTEWVILFSMIWQWKKSVPYQAKAANQMPYKLLMATDFWIFLNLVLALLFSIPSINFFTHGTHITVAHSMGTTIGINSTILLASLLYIAREINPALDLSLARKGFSIFNFSLFFFWISLMVAGVKKSVWQYFSKNVAFGELQDDLHWVYISFVVFGIGIFIGIGMIAQPLMKTFLSVFSQRKNPGQHLPNVPAMKQPRLIPEEIEA